MSYKRIIKNRNKSRYKVDFSPAYGPPVYLPTHFKRYKPHYLYNDPGDYPGSLYKNYTFNPQYFKLFELRWRYIRHNRFSDAAVQYDASQSSKNQAQQQYTLTTQA